MSTFLLWLVLWLLTWPEANARESVSCKNSSTTSFVNVSSIIDYSSRIGKEQKIAMEIAVRDAGRLSCSKPALKLNSSDWKKLEAVSAATQLANSKQVQAVIGTQLNESELVAKIYKTSKKLPIISLTSMATPESNPVPLPYFIQMANDVTIHMQCLADIVGQFRWRKVTAIYEQNDGFTSNSSILTYLSNNLWDVNSEIDEHVAFPSLASLSDPKATIEQKLKSLQKKSNRVFLIVQSSLEFAVMLFEKANQMGMIEKGSAWIISDSVASHLDSLDPSVTDNMQGILGCKTNFSATSSKFRNFKFKFRGKFLSEFPKEENQEPSLFALRAYDTIWAIFLALKKSQGNFSLEAFSKSILSSNFDGLSGKISFKNGRLNQAPIFKIVNVFGRSYKELAFWSNISGFSKYPVTHQAMEGRSQNNSSGVLGTVNWPGGSQTVPKGWVYRYEGKPLKIGVPLNGACPHLMHVSYDQNKTKVTGFSADVFRKSSKHLPYDLSYDFVPFNGTYNEMVKHVNNKVIFSTNRMHEYAVLNIGHGFAAVHDRQQGYFAMGVLI